MANSFKDKMKKMISVAYNLVIRSAAHGISSVMNQLIYLPMLGRMFDSATYGLILTVISVVNCVKDVLGSSLNNVRLVMNNQYEEKKVKGDFNIILCALLVLSSLIMFVFYRIFPEIGLLQLILLLPTVWLLIFDSYATVWYYLILDLKKTLFSSIINAIGLIVGLRLVKVTSLWPIANLVAAILVTIFLFCSTPILREPFTVTKHFSSVIKKLSLIALSSLLSSLLVYLDKLILYPIIGGEAVSTYSVAVFFGKTLNICIIPASSVLLGYFAQKNFKMTRKRYWLINASTWGILGAFIVAVIFVSPVFTQFFYPTLYADAAPYVLIGNTAAALGSIAYVTQAVALKYAPTKWILIIQIVYCAVYLVSGITFLNLWGLYGFCIVIVLSNFVKLVFMYIICHYYISKRGNQVT